MLLQELLGEVLEVALREGSGGDNGDLGVVATGDSDGFTEVVGAAADLDAVVQELLLCMCE